MDSSAQRGHYLWRVPAKWWMILGYISLLGLSAAFPFLREIEKASDRDPILVSAFDFKDDKVAPTGQLIPVQYKLYGWGENGVPEGKKIVVYLHRVPWDKRGSSLCEALAQTGQVAVVEPYLPGFRSSSDDVPSHAMEAHAEVIADLLQRLGVKRYHLIGQGYGGAAALSWAANHQDRVQSVTLLSSPGVQPFELLGNSLVNKIVYGFQGAFFWSVSRLTPNFGAADLLPWDRNYARTVFDTDLSDNDKILANLGEPLLIIHGQDDWLTPVDSAIYSSQLVPGSVLKLLPGGRNAVFESQSEVVQQITNFVGSPPQVKSANRETPPLPLAHGMHYWILLCIIIVCTFVAEDPTCLAAGLLVAIGMLDFWSATAACFCGIVIGDLTLYMLGRVFGREAIRHAPLKWLIPEHKVNQWSGWFSTPKGMLVVVSSRFVPASRLPTFITAGIMRLNLARLSLLLFVAALAWTPPLIWVGHKFGEAGMAQLHRFKSNALWVILGVLLALHFVTHWLVPALTWRGRRQIVMKVRNLIQPSLWPAWLVFLPIRLGIVFLSLRHRSLTAFASANPSFGRIGGFIGDSKSLLLRPFQRDSRCCPLLALTLEDPVAERIKEAEAFAVCHGYPLVFKPEVSEDGAGLRYVRTAEQLRRWVESAKEDFILQKYITGLEYEIVWRRSPGQDDGHLMALMQKEDVVVMGDGDQTLEELIWLDEVAVSRGELYLRCHDRELNRVVAAGEQVVLNLSGSYGHGARCVHRPDLMSSELEQAISLFAKRFPALHFARFDVRAVSEAELKAGRFMVTEIGGCCHVSSLVRDPSLRFSRSYRAVWQQLAVCVQTGAQNLKQKVRPVPLEELIARWSQARGRSDEFVIHED